MLSAHVQIHCCVCFEAHASCSFVVACHARQPSGRRVSRFSSSLAHAAGAAPSPPAPLLRPVSLNHFKDSIDHIGAASGRPPRQQPSSLAATHLWRVQGRWWALLHGGMS